MKYIDELLEKHQVRKSAAQKEAFRSWAREKCQGLGYACREDAHGKKGQTVNLIAGDPEKADIVFTAHYDTCSRSPMPNMIFPKNILFTLLAQMPLILMMLVPSIGVGLLMEKWTGDTNFYMLGFMVVYFGLFFLLLRGPANQHTANDNSSGTAALLQIMEMLPEERRNRAAFIFFDDEEKGKVGSKAYAKANPEQKKDKLIFNLDCIGDGEHVLVVAPKKADAGLTGRLSAAFRDEGPYRAVHCSARDTAYNSDQRSFDRGVAVSACHKNVFGYFVPRIHTSRDRICCQENLDYVCRGAVALLEKVTDAE